MSACLRIAMASGSIARTKSNGERGQPCLVPRLSLNGVDTSPLVKFSACGLEYKSWTHQRKCTPTPNLCRTSNRYCHSILSKAFSASNDRTEWSRRPDFSNRILSNRLVLWKPCLPCTNPLWSKWTIRGKTRSSLLASTLHRILRSLFRREIGLQDPHWVGVFLGFSNNVWLCSVKEGGIPHQIIPCSYQVGPVIWIKIFYIFQ